jgi:hypothetical protein
VADHPAPALDLDPLAGDLEVAVEDRVGIGAQELRLRKLGPVEEIPWEVVEGLMLIGERQVPSGGERRGLHQPRPPPFGERCIGHPDVGVGSGVKLVRAELTLGRPRSGGRGVEENEPERAGRSLLGTLVDGVANPGAPPATRLGQLQVEALVVPGLLGDAGESSLGPHRRDAIA